MSDTNIEPYKIPLGIFLTLTLNTGKVLSGEAVLRTNDSWFYFETDKGTEIVFDDRVEMVTLYPPEFSLEDLQSRFFLSDKLNKKIGYCAP